jgi:S-DNA-T family DNA segregation ATPase FtsK/SpoIIIE
MESKDNNNKEPEYKKRFIGGLILLAVGLLLFFSVYSYTLEDIDVRIAEADLGFRNIITLHFPQVDNMVGVFGALLSYATIYLFSKPFGFILAVFFVTAGFILIFGYKLPKISRKLWLTLLLLAFLTFFYFSVGGNFEYNTGIFFSFIVEEIFYPIFKPVGTSIIFGLAVISMIFFVAGPERLISWTKRLFTGELFSLSKNGKKEKVSTRSKPTVSYLTPGVSERDVELKRPEPSISITTATSKPFSLMKGEYRLPDYNKILKDSSPQTRHQLEERRREIEENSRLLCSKLAEFGIEGEVQNVNIGPIITQYELRPAPGMKISRFTSLADDLALAMKASKIRIVAPIPGKDTIGFEIPNKHPDVIRLKDVIASQEMRSNPSPTLIALGKDITGKPFVTDLKDLRHLLVAGLTGSGKSVCLNIIINSILYRATPEQVRFILFDPKKIEFSVYEQIPHLIKEVITEPKDVLYLLNWAVGEMERRYDIFATHNVRNIDDFNRFLLQAPEYEDLTRLPYIIVMVDELADLMQSLSKEIERPLRRLSGMARAVGIYLVFATQRPSVDVINGMIKANFPSRISFQVYSKVDSRTVLDMDGADRLLGEGDMLFSPLGKKPPIRIHGSLVTTEEVKKLAKYLSQFPRPEMDISLPSESSEEEFEYDDELFPEAVRIAVDRQFASVSMMQRKFHIGYARAGRLIEMMERARIVEQTEGSKPRKVLINKDDLEKMGF